MFENFSRTAIFKITLVAIILLFVFQTGCTVQLISSYDATLDNAITNLYQKIETFFLTLKSQEGLPECGYEHHMEFYKDAKVSINTIEIRARAIPDNNLTIQQVGLLKENIESLEKLHQIGCLTNKQIETLRMSFNSAFTAILKLELAKKRGD